VEGLTPTEKARPAGVSNGIYYGADGTSVTLCTYAASKTASANRVFLIGDMTDWELSPDYQLYKDGNYFWITLTGLTPGQEYRFQYAVERADGTKKQISDLYSEKVIHPDDKYEPKTVDSTLIDYPTKNADGYVTVIQPSKPAFQWSDATINFKRPDKNNLVIYELWVYDYTTDRSIKGVMDRLDYIQNLGVNAIELMPICEFDGNKNWGYSPNHYFAPDKAYGSETMIKTFIDECHKRGIAVILDMVFNHATGLNPMNKLYPYGSDLQYNPWFNVTAPHSDNVYEDWNHGFEPAHEMFIRALKYWLTEYKVDGYRLDLSHGLCSDQANTSVANLKDYYTKGVKSVSSDAYMILEHWGSNMATERPALVNAGMMCWSNTSNAYCQTAMGWLKDGDAFTDASADGYISYCESHDEERMQYKCKQYGYETIKTNEATRLGRVAQNVAFNVLLNGSHMLWMWEEVGYDFSINSSYESPNAYMEANRCEIKPRPEKSGYFALPARTKVFTQCAQIITLRTQLMPNVFKSNPSNLSVGSGQALRTIQWGFNVFVAANFSASENQTATAPYTVGKWYNYLNGATEFSGSITLKPGELLILTAQPVVAPTFSDINKRSHEGVEAVETQVEQGYKFMQDGRIYIRRGDKTYTIMGQPVK